MPVRKGKKNQVLKTNAVSSSSAADTVDKQMSEILSWSGFRINRNASSKLFGEQEFGHEVCVFSAMPFPYFHLLHCEYFIPYYSQNLDGL